MAVEFSEGPVFQGSTMLEGVARQVVADVNQFFSKERLEHAAAQGERQRLANELHDGLLQTLTGVTLQLETIARLLDSDKEAARDRLRDVGTMIASEQRALRLWIAKLSRTTPEAMASAVDLAEALEKLCRQVELQWGVEAELTVSPRGYVPRNIADHLYRIVQESLTNIGRHARAQVARVDLQISLDQVDVTVTDDGIGFPFEGRFDLATLTAKGIGPRSLKERVAALHGELILSTGASGTRLTIAVPLMRDPWARRQVARVYPSGHD